LYCLHQFWYACWFRVGAVSFLTLRCMHLCASFAFYSCNLHLNRTLFGGPTDSRKILNVQVKAPILKNPILWLLVFACATIVLGLSAFSISDFDGGKTSGPVSEVFFIVSICIIGFGLLLTFISLVAGLVMLLRSCFSRGKNVAQAP
jgi:hypothetical protein